MSQAKKDFDRLDKEAKEREARVDAALKNLLGIENARAKQETRDSKNREARVEKALYILMGLEKASQLAEEKTRKKDEKGKEKKERDRKKAFDLVFNMLKKQKLS